MIHENLKKQLIEHENFKKAINRARKLKKSNWLSTRDAMTRPHVLPSVTLVLLQSYCQETHFIVKFLLDFIVSVFVSHFYYLEWRILLLLRSGENLRLWSLATWNEVHWSVFPPFLNAQCWLCYAMRVTLGVTLGVAQRQRELVSILNCMFWGGKLGSRWRLWEKQS